MFLLKFTDLLAKRKIGTCPSLSCFGKRRSIKSVIWEDTRFL